MTEPRDPIGASDSLSVRQYVAFGCAFAVLPVLCIVLSSILHYAWRETSPTKARQINTLAQYVFLSQVLLVGGSTALMAWLGAFQ